MKVLPAALAALALAALALAAPTGAQAPGNEFFLLASKDRTGTIDLIVFGPQGTSATLGETIGGEFRRLGAVTIGAEGTTGITRAALWSCERKTRRFAAFATLPDGTTRTASYDIRTPSCRRRLALSLPKRAAPGARVRAIVRDRWRIGDVGAQLCAAGPKPGYRCRFFELAAGETRASKTFRLPRGRWRFELDGPGQKIRRPVLVGTAPGGRLPQGGEPPVLLMTGDSMIQSLDTILTDRLSSRVRTVTDIRPASGLAHPGLDWPALARRQAARVKPDVTVVFVGVTDGFDMTTPAGVEAPCCGEPWVAEYARRAGEMMSTYARGGNGRVVWIALPAPRQASRHEYHVAVNAAVRRAAPEATRTTLVRLDQVLTPGFEYRDFMTYRGRRLRVRADDGVHLSVAGSSIAVDLLMRVPALRRLRG